MEGLDYKALTTVGDGDIERIVRILCDQWNYDEEEIVLMYQTITSI